MSLLIVTDKFNKIKKNDFRLLAPNGSLFYEVDLLGSDYNVIEIKKIHGSIVQTQWSSGLNRYHSFDANSSLFIARYLNLPFSVSGK